jgi:hypothetical protein
MFLLQIQSKDEGKNLFKRIKVRIESEEIYWTADGDGHEKQTFWCQAHWIEPVDPKNKEILVKLGIPLHRTSFYSELVTCIENDPRLVRIY